MKIDRTSKLKEKKRKSEIKGTKINEKEWGESLKGKFFKVEHRKEAILKEKEKVNKNRRKKKRIRRVTQDSKQMNERKFLKKKKEEIKVFLMVFFVFYFGLCFVNFSRFSFPRAIHLKKEFQCHFTFCCCFLLFVLLLFFICG